MYCTRCGMKCADSNSYCSNCGNQLNSAQPVPPGSCQSGKSKVVAGLLGIFLGSIGIHSFYLGYNTIGVIQIVVTLLTFGVGGLWGFIEGILIFAGTINRDAQGVPLKD